MNKFHPEDQSPERHSIHGGSPSPVRSSHGNVGSLMGSSAQNQYSNQSLQKNHKQFSGSSGASAATSSTVGSQGSNFLGANIDGIPQGNRSPPRNQRNTDNNNNNN